MKTLKVVIAEDEKLIRNGIVSSIDWKSLHTCVAGAVRNGTEALEIIRKTHPDILLTDIRMADGDGLTLIKEVNMNYPNVRIIIISGYDNFEYAQKAIQLGVEDYILKPIDIDKLQEIIHSLADQIRTDIDTKKDYEKLENFYQENRQTLINDFFRELLFGTINKSELADAEDRFGYQSQHSYYFPFIMYMEIKNPIEWRRLKSEILDAVTPIFQRQGFFAESIFSMPDEIFYTDITFVLSVLDPSTSLREILPCIKKKLESIPEISLLAVGVGELCTSLLDLSFSYHVAKTHALYSMISELNAKNSAEESRYAIPRNIYETTSMFYDIFINHDSKRLKDYFKGVEVEIEYPDNEMSYKQMLLRNLFVCVLSAGDELGIPVRKFFPDLVTLFRYINLKTIRELLIKVQWVCETIMSQYQTRSQRSGIDLMDRAKSYILKNYTDPLLSIEAVSSHLSLTPAYFSKLYKQAHGSTYIETVTELRMEKAEEYLVNSSKMKISAVAVAVGYNSPTYFNYLFKKFYGLTPKNFRIKHCFPQIES